MTQRRLTPLTRRLLASALPVAAVLAPAGAGLADPGIVLNRYALPGAIDTPSAEMMPDGTLGAVLGYSGIGGNGVGVSFQVLPRVSAVLRYGKFDNEAMPRGYTRDRSFDLRLQLLTEDPDGWRPSVAVGLQDFIGTGYYSSEYIVATRNLTPRLRVSAGLGWGRLASSGGIGSFTDSRPVPAPDDRGRLNNAKWFRGDMAPFASVAWQATDKLTLLAEYSGDDYACETGDASCAVPEWRSDDEALKNNLNLGLSYQAGQHYNIGAYVLGGRHFGVQASMALNPRQAPYPSGLESAPAPVRPRAAPAADPEGWSGRWSADPTAQPAIQKALATALAKEGQTLESMALTATRAEVRIRNHRHIQQAEAIGRTVRLMTRALPPSVETLVVTPVEGGMPVSSLTFRRSDVERLENTEAGRIAAVATLSDPAARNDPLVQSPGIAPRFQWSLGPSFTVGMFDPDEPIRYEVGAALNGSYELSPGLTVKGTLRQRLFGNADQREPTGDNNGIPRVRSDSRMYSGNDRPQVPELVLNWNAHPAPAIYTRVTVGLLETMYGGISTELLWKPVDSRLALGAEVNRVRKRDYRDAFEFLDYETTTAHVSAYYELGGGFMGQLDVGKYLAGDTGATLSLRREFASGWSVSAYVTKTDLSDDDSGEGSFDKGVSVQIPMNWALGTPSKRTVGGSISSTTRDSGQRVRTDRLYHTVRDGHSTRIYDGWGRFWR